MKKRKKTCILLVKGDQPKRELEFELDFQASLTTQQRFEMMFKRSDQIKETLIRHGYRKPVEIVKHT